MKRLVSLLTAIFVVLLSVPFVCAENAVSLNTDAAAPSFQMTLSGGQVITSETFAAGRNLLLVYGRTLCWNTRSFLENIQPVMDQLALSGITVLVGLHDDPSDEEMQEFAETFPGIVCAKVTNNYFESGMWTGLEAVGAGTDSVIFPVVFYRTNEGRIRYYSTGYVYEPLALTSAVMEHSLPSQAEILLPEHLSVIEDGAFRGAGFSSVYCGRQVVSIGACTFADNPSLKWIFLSPGVTGIDETAFSGCSSDMVIFGKAGSYAQTFAEKYGIPFQGI